LRGDLVRPAKCCVNSHNCKGRIEGHHDDYSKPLDVEWFCVYHHRLIPPDIDLRTSYQNSGANKEDTPAKNPGQ
jgi:hypothetical protein